MHIKHTQRIQIKQTNQNTSKTKHAQFTKQNAQQTDTNNKPSSKIIHNRIAYKTQTIYTYKYNQYTHTCRCIITYIKTYHNQQIHISIYAKQYNKHTMEGNKQHTRITTQPHFIYYTHVHIQNTHT